MVNHYEIMWIIGNDLRDDQSIEIQSNVTQFVSESAGNVILNEKYGKRTLAYNISGYSEGEYYVSRFSMDSSQIKNLEKNLKDEDGIIRYLITVIKPDAVLISPTDMDVRSHNK